jgi:PAS domain S-box-containing protein
MVKTSWGWSYVLAPGYLFFYVFAIASLITGLSVVGFDMRHWASRGERAQGRGLMLGIMVPLTVASLTDGVLPLLDIHVWHLGTTSIALLGAIVTWTFHRYGYSLLAPGTFAKEILETMPDGVALLHLDGRIRRVNPAMVEMAGFDEPNELFGLPVSDVIDGQVLGPGEIHHEVEMRITTREGAMPTPVAVSTRILRNRLDETTGVVVVCRDLREIVSLRQRVLIGGRMAAVGQLAAGVAHELNNPMAYVRANVTLLLKHWEHQRASTRPLDEASDTDEIWEEGVELISETIEGIERATSIVRDIKTFSHGGSPDLEVTSLGRLLDATVRIASPHLRHRARVERRGEELPVIDCAPREVQQVFLNLLINAVDANPEEAGSEASELPLIEIETSADARNVYVRFSDHGEGIPADCLECIFDPFFTTKPAGEGTGLGLALSYEIVRKHGGDLRVESQPGIGSSFTVVLPRGGHATDEEDG